MTYVRKADACSQRSNVIEVKEVMWYNFPGIKLVFGSDSLEMSVLFDKIF